MSRSTVMSRTPAPRPSFALRPISLAACLVGAAPAAWALPQGAVPNFGQTTVKQTAPTQLDVKQTSQRAGIDWTSFSIGSAERVVISQPGRNAVLLNRVLGNDPSQILGSLQANGNVWLINPRGILFGANSRVDVGGLLASTLAIDNDAARYGGRIQLGRDAGGAGEIRADGRITARDGTVALVAPQLTLGGTIEAHRVGLAAATSVQVDVEGDGLVFFDARNDGSLTTRLSLLGNVLADGGSAEVRAAARAGFADTVLNLEGVVRARAIGQRDGRVVIDGGNDGITRIAGTLDASAAQGHGGDIRVEGQRVLLAGSALLDASGADGGGRVRVGGGFQGHDTEVRNAEMVSVAPEAQLRADATGSGDGGRIVVWSDQATRFAGQVLARGGADGGQGGSVEVSSKGFLDFRGAVDLSAPRGRAGSLLLDPTNLTIQASAPDINGDATTGDDLGSATLAFGAPGTESKITAGAVVTQLHGALVTLQAENNITVATPIDVTGDALATGALKLQAGNSITLNTNAAINVRGDLTLSTHDPSATAPTATGALSVGNGATLTTGGTLLITNNAGTGVHSLGANINANAFTLTGAATLSGTLASTNVTINDTGSLTLGAANLLANTATVIVAGGATLNIGGGNETIATLDLSGTLSGGATRTLTANTSTLLKDNAVVGAKVAGSGAITVSGSGATAVTLGQTAAQTTVNITSGKLTVNASNLLADSATVGVSSAGTLNLAGAVTDTIAALNLSGTLASGGGGAALTVSGLSALTGGAVSALLVTDTLTNTSGTSTLQAGVSVATLTTVSGGTLVVGNGTTSGSLGGAGDITLNAPGELKFNRSNANLALSSIGGSGGTITQAGSDTLTFGSGIGNNRTVNVDNGIVALQNGPARLGSGATVNVTNGATLTLGNADENVAAFSLRGTLGGNATLTSTGGYTMAAGGTDTVNAKLGSGTLTVQADTALNGTAAAGTVNVDAGTLTLGSAGRLTATPAVTVANVATLALGGAETVDTLVLSGHLTGATTLTANTSTTLAGGTADSNLAGSTLLVTSNSTLNGTAAATTVNVSGGTLTLGSPGRLAAGADVSVSGTGLALGGNENVNTLTLAGTLGGSGNKLTTAGATTLQSGASVVANLGAASLAVTGDASLSGTADATTVNVSGGTLTLAAGGRFTSTPGVTVGNGAALALGGNETIAALTLGGTIGGSGTLSGTTLLANSANARISSADVLLSGVATVAPAATLSVGAGSGVSAGSLSTTSIDLGAASVLAYNRSGAVSIGAIGGTAGSLQLAGGGSYTLNGSAPTITQLQLSGSGSALTLTAPNIIPDGATVTTGTGTTLTLGGNETVGALALSGTLTGSGTLSAGTLGLAGGTVGALVALDGATLDSSGSSTLNGTANAGTVNVNGGKLTLGSAGRLTNTPALFVGPNAELALGGDETATALTLNNGSTLSGSAKLTAASYAIGGSTVSANLGTGAVTSTGVSSISGTVDAATLNVGSGALSISGSNRLTASPVVTVNGGAALALADSETIASLAGAGDVGIAAGTLTTGGAGSTLFSGALSGGGGLTKTGAGIFTLSGLNTYAGITTISQGTLRLGTGLNDGSAGSIGNTAKITNNAALAFNRFDDLTFDKVIEGSGTLQKAGAGTLTLSGANTYTGTTTIAEGTLSASNVVASGGSSNLGNAATAVVLGDATHQGTLVYTGAAATFTRGLTVNAGGGQLGNSGPGTLTVASGGIGAGGLLTLGGSGDITVAGSSIISGAGGLTKTGAGTLTLSGANTYTGITTVAEGTLSASNIVVTAGSSNLGNAATAVVLGDATHQGTLAYTGAATTFTRGIRVNAGGGRISNAGPGALAVAGGGISDGTSAGGVVTLGGSGDITVSSNITSTGGLTKAGADTVTLFGANTYGGTTTVSGGTLVAANNAALGSSDGSPATGTTVQGGATLRLAGVDIGSEALALSGAGVGNAGALQGSGAAVSNGAITLAADATIGVAAGADTFAVGGNIGGAAGLSKAGPGTLVLSGANTYAGATTISEGTLSASKIIVAGGSSNLGNAATAVVLGDATHQGTLSYTGPAGTFTRGFIVNAGGGRLGTTGPGALTLGTGAISAGGLLTLGGVGDITVTSAISGSAGLAKTGADTLTLAGANSYAGNTTINGGKLILASSTAAGNGSGTVAVGANELIVNDGAAITNPVTIQGGTLGNSSGAGTLAGPGHLTLLASSFVTVSGSGSGVTINRVIDQSPAALPPFGLTVTGGAMTLTQHNTFSGGVALGAGGQLVLGAGGDAGPGPLSIGGGRIEINNGSVLGNTLSISGGTIATTAGAGTLTGNLTISGAATLESLPTGAGTGLTVSGLINETGGSFAITKTGPGVVTLTAPNLYSGGTTISAGTLRVSGAGTAGTGAIAVGSSQLMIDNGADVANAVTVAGGTIGNGAGTGTLSGTLTLGATSNLASSGGGLTVSGNIGQSLAGLGLNTAGGSITLSGTNSYTGTTTVNAGTLALQGGAAIDDGAAVVLADAAGVQLALLSSETIGSLAGGGPVGGPANGSVALGANTLSTGGNNASTTFSGVIGGSGNLVKQGSGTFTLAGANTYGGSATVSAGTLVAGNSAALGASDGSAATGTTVQDGATLRVGSVDIGNEALSLTGSGVAAGGALQGSGTARAGGPLTLAGDTAVGVGAAPDSLTLAGAIGESGGARNLTKVGLGTVVLSTPTASTYSGTTTVSAGTLRASTDAALPDAGAVVLADGSSAVFELNSNQTIGSLAGGGPVGGSATGSVALGANTLSTGGNDASTTFSGVIGGSGNLVKQGSGSFTLAGAGNYGGSTTVQAGTLRSSATLASPTVNVTGGTFALDPGSNLADASAVTVASGATFTLAGDETIGQLTLSGTLGGSGTLTAGSTTLAGGTVNLNLGPGTLVSGGASQLNGNAAAGTVTVNDGTLTLGSAGRFSAAPAVTVASGATLALGGDDSVASLTLHGTLTGSGTLTAATYTLAGGAVDAALGAGALTSSGNSTIAAPVGAGTVAIGGGTLTLSGNDRLADGAAVTVANGATLALGGNDQVASVVLQGTLGGTGRLSAATVLLDGGSANADIGAGTLTSRGASSLNGNALASTLAVETGTLALGSASRLGAATVATVASGATLALGGDDTLGSLGGSGRVELGAATLATGSAGASRFDGVIAGSGGLTKQGSGDFVLSGTNTYTGTTRVEAGTLVVGDGGSNGSLATSAFAVDGALRFARADQVTLAQPVSGGGSVEQAGSGRLVFTGGNKTYSGATRVTSGELATAAAENLPDASDVVVAPGARLTLAGAETVRSVDADGAVSLAGNLSASGSLLMRGPVVAAGGVPLVLTGQQIDAVNDGNLWGSSLSIHAGGAIALSSGRENGAYRPLTIGDLGAAAGGEIDAGKVTILGLASLSGGTLALVSDATAAPIAPDASVLGKNTPAGRQIAFADDVVTQASSSRIDVGEGAVLSVVSTKGGSVQLLADTNQFGGGVSVRSGAPVSPWSGNIVSASFGSGPAEVSMQSRVRINGTTVRIGGAGIEADVVSISADQLSSAPGATIVARMPFDNLVGTRDSTPALTLELLPQAFNGGFSFGQRGGGEIAINVGSRAWGNRTLPIDGGFVSVLPRHGARGSTAVILTGPQVAGGYGFFFDGAGDQTEIPVFYNGDFPVTPQVMGSISAIVSVSEGARKELFDEAVRTENVAVRLRAGVIAEVGPGRPATVGTEGAQPPETCPPAGATLSCGPP